MAGDLGVDAHELGLRAMELVDRMVAVRREAVADAVAAGAEPMRVERLAEIVETHALRVAGKLTRIDA